MFYFSSIYHGTLYAVYDGPNYTFAHRYQRFDITYHCVVVWHCRDLVILFHSNIINKSIARNHSVVFSNFDDDGTGVHMT